MALSVPPKLSRKGLSICLRNPVPQVASLILTKDVGVHCSFHLTLDSFDEPAVLTQTL